MPGDVRNGNSAGRNRRWNESQLQHEEEERREAEKKAREGLAAQRREERKVARQVRLLTESL